MRQMKMKNRLLSVLIGFAFWSIAAPQTANGQVGSWVGSGNLNENRGWASTITLLKNGKVLAVGGGTTQAGGQVGMSSCELYDPATGIWSYTGSLNVPRFFHTATLLADGKVLVFGNSQQYADLSSEIYDPATGVWSFSWQYD